MTATPSVARKPSAARRAAGATAASSAATKATGKSAGTTTTKAVAGETVATKAPPAAKSAAKSTTKAAKAPAKRAAKAAGSAVVKSELTTRELAQLRTALEAELVDLQAEYDRSIVELNDLQLANTDGAGDDQADAGSKTFEREQEQSIANNRHDLIVQIQRAISRIDSGTYGLCENCGKPIPKARLQALPMATLDAACKAREERR